MPTTGEKKAVWFLAIVVLSGSVMRLCRTTAPALTLADEAALATQLARVDSARAMDHRRGTKRDRARGRLAGQRDTSAPVPPAAPGTPAASAAPEAVDVDRASEAEIEALPGIGPALARRIVSFRDSAGPFGSIGALCAVSGIGPKLAEKLRPLVTFTGPRSPVSDECGGASKDARKSRGARSRKSR